MTKGTSEQEAKIWTNTEGIDENEDRKENEGKTRLKQNRDRIEDETKHTEKTEQTKQNKTKQNKTKQHPTKQNQTK